MLGILLFYYIIKIIYKKWLDYQSNKDRSYNVFDKAELSNNEKSNLRRWGFSIPWEFSNDIVQEVRE